MKLDDSTVFTRHPSALGAMVIACSPRGLAGVWFEGQKHMPDLSRWTLQQDHPLLVEAARQLDDYFAARRARFDLPLDLQAGTVFQQSVWRALLSIPSGSTTSYGELSWRVGLPRAPRAVGAAVGRNPLSIVVPCHRVVGSKGALTGYAGGVERKQALLRLEGALM